MSQNKSLPVSVIVPTKNEEQNIKDCLESLYWADEIIVVDSFSEDRTEDFAKKMGAEVIQFDYDGGWPKKKNWTIKNYDFNNEWILIIDADERVPEELKSEIGSAIKDDSIKGYYVRWKFVFLDKWMKHAWSHGWMLRLFKKGYGQYEDLGMRGEGGWDNEVHENIIVEGKTAKLDNYLLHDTNESLSFWIKKQNEFSDWNSKRRYKEEHKSMEAKFKNIFSNDPLKRRRILKWIFLKLPFKPILIFIYLYFFKMGFLDGKEGLYFCALRASHELNINAKVFELKKKNY